MNAATIDPHGNISRYHLPARIVEPKPSESEDDSVAQKIANHLGGGYVVYVSTVASHLFVVTDNLNTFEVVVDRPDGGDLSLSADGEMFYTFDVKDHRGLHNAWSAFRAALEDMDL